MRALNGGERSVSPDQIPVNDGKLQRLRDLKRLKDLGPSERQPAREQVADCLQLCIKV